MCCGNEAGRLVINPAMTAKKAMYPENFLLSRLSFFPLLLLLGSFIAVLCNNATQISSSKNEKD